MKEKLNGLIDRLTALPTEISDLQVNALALNDTIQLISDEIVKRESEIKTEINAAIDENGKKLYSNDEARKIAFLTDSKEDSDLSTLYAEKARQSHKLDLIRISIEQHSNEQRNIRAILLVVNLVTED
jgi:hypothetical protein